MPDFYYQIKGKRYEDEWAWPPVFCGLVSATNKKKAKLLIDEEYGREFPQRVLRKDIEDQAYLLKIQEITDGDDALRSLFEPNECKQCGKSFKRVDLYNDHNESYKGTEFCSSACCNTYRDENRVVPVDIAGNGKPVIYRIYNIKTKMSYVGKTTQIFTLRWYQHFYQGGSCKFHKTIKSSSVDDWQFSIIEVVDLSKKQECEDILAARERYWIEKLDCIENGYNSIK